MNFKFASRTEAGFYDYMMSHRNYKESTVLHYIRRIRAIEPMETLIKKDLDPIIRDYEKGSQENMNSTCHNAYSCALKRLQEYQTVRGIVVI